MLIRKWQGMSPITPARLVVCVALALVLFHNKASWVALHGLVPLQGLSTVLFYLSFAVFLTALFSLLLTLVSCRYLLKPALTLLLLCSAVATYFMNSYGITIDAVMIQNVFETNTAEAGDLLNRSMLGYLLVLGVLPLVLVWCVPVVYPPFWRGVRDRLVMLVSCLVVIVVVVGPFYSTYAPVFREEDKLTHFINPTNYIYAVGKFARRHLATKETLTMQPVGRDSKAGATLGARPKKSLVIFVVGETARADHFSLNGYGRLTNPKLQQQDLLNYTDVHSCGTATAVSLPCMFSKFNREDYNDTKGKTYENVLDMLQRAGVTLFWRNNNSGDCKGACVRIPHDDVSNRTQGPFCNETRCLDEVMLEDLQAYVDTLTDHAMIVLHSDGSHGPEYFDRYPASFERFTPVCRTNQLGSCSNEELVNVYDNTILYTDHFLNEVIEFLKRNSDKRDTAMIYVSDHGESLGENGLYLHAAPYSIAPESQTHVPMLVWFSQDAFKHWSLDRDCLHLTQEEPLTHDNIFHTLLGLFDVQSVEYKPAMDMFNGCRAHRAAAPH